MNALMFFLLMTAFNTVLTLFPVTFRLSFRKEFQAKVSFLFFHYTIFPRPQKPEKKKKAPQKPEKHVLKQLLGKKGLSGFLSLLTEAAKIVSGTAARLFRHLLIKEFLLDIAVSGDDAAKTALKYAHVCAAVGSACGLLFGNIRYQDREIRITPDFRSDKSSVRFRAVLSIRLMFLLSALLYALIHSVKLFRNARESPAPRDHQEKAVFL